MHASAADIPPDWVTRYARYISPMQFEKNWLAAQLKDAA